MMRELTDIEWADLQARKPGAMLYGVVTTGIYCRAGCPARTPLRKNARWLDSASDAVAAGLRACKRCKPDPRPVLDCLGLLCPLPVLRARKVLAGMMSGQVLTLLTSDPMALIDLPHFCGQTGHSYLGMTQTATQTATQTRHQIRVA